MTAVVLWSLSACGAADSATTASSTSLSSTTPDSALQGPVTTAVVPGAAAGSIDIQGHRGARGIQPENTLPAFETALDLGVTTLELDLHFTADDRVVVWHDPIIDASKCGLAAGAEGPDPDDPLTPDEDLMIANLPVAELGNYVCDRNPDKARFPDQEAIPTSLAGSDYRITTLDDLFDFVATYATDASKTAEQREAALGVLFNIETKRKPDSPQAIGDGFDGTTAGPFELAILEVVGGRDLVDRVTIQSFDHRSLWAVHAANPDLRLAALTSRQAPDLEEYATRGASIWSPNQADVTPERIEEAHGLGLLVIPWTINEVDDMKNLLDIGVDGLITDRPDLALTL